MELILKAKDIRVEFKGRDVLDINPNRSLELTRSMGSPGHPWLPIYL